MIVVDTSALLEVVFNQPYSSLVAAKLQTADKLAISAATMAELLVVARRRGVGPEMEESLGQLSMEVVPVDGAFARKVADAYDRWGKGVHPASLNFADCFAYALATERGCLLLFVGEDFSKTDVAVAMNP
ncbi:MAG TPA: type II toxin-antitoxin system VapC family toxin [Hyphomonadaceae bacterium]|nr:type II toxin-antitoxin system VapC family toxin [Hyphomonadaceae bacterium]